MTGATPIVPASHGERIGLRIDAGLNPGYDGGAADRRRSLYESGFRTAAEIGSSRSTQRAGRPAVEPSCEEGVDVVARGRQHTAVVGARVGPVIDR